MNIQQVRQEIVDKGYNVQRQEWIDSIDKWMEEIDLIRACLEGFKPCIARADALRAIKAITGGPSEGNLS